MVQTKCVCYKSIADYLIPNQQQRQFHARLQSDVKQFQFPRSYFVTVPVHQSDSRSGAASGDLHRARATRVERGPLAEHWASAETPTGVVVSCKLMNICNTSHVIQITAWARQAPNQPETREFSPGNCHAVCTDLDPISLFHTEGKVKNVV
jgi:hypothetical protein